MNQLIQLIQNQKRQVTVYLFFENGLSIKLQNVRVLSNQFLIGINQFPGETFIPIKHIWWYYLPKISAGKDESNKEIDKQKEVDIKYKEPSIILRRSTSPTYFLYQSFYNDFTIVKEEEKKDYCIDSSIDKEFLNGRKIESHEEFAVKKGVIGEGDIEPYAEVSTQKDNLSLKQLVSPNLSNRITKSITELQQNKSKKRESPSLYNIKISSTNANSSIKESGTFTDKLKG